MKKLVSYLVPIALAVGAVIGAFSIASADPVDAAPGSGSQVAPAPHEQLHDPVDQPVETLRDLGDSRKVGWPAFIAAIVLVLCKLAGRAKSKIRWLGEGWRPVAFTLAAAAAGGVYDAAFLGGTGTALVIALIVAVVAAIPNKGPEPQRSPA